MGIDNSAKLIFGIEIDYETLMRIMEKLSENEDIEFYEFSELFFDKYDLSCITAYPYYDCGYENAKFYISLIDGDEISLTDLSEIWDKNKENYSKCLKELEIEYEEPKLMAVPHIW